MKRSIEYLDYYIPEKSVSIEDIIRFNEESDEAIKSVGWKEFATSFKQRSGLDKISVFSGREDLLQGLENMIVNMFKVTGISPEKVKYLVFGNDTFLNGKVSIAHYIQAKYNFFKAIILPLYLVCVSTVTALGLSEKLLLDKEEEYMLIISNGERNNLKNRYVGFTILGDGVSLVLVKNDYGKININSWRGIDNGRASLEYVKGKGEIRNVSAIQKHLITNGVKFIQDSMRKFKIDYPQIHKIIQVNTNRQVWEKVYPQLLDTREDIFYLDNLSYGGHINDVDYVRNLKDYMDSKENVNRNLDSWIAIYGANLTTSHDISYNYCILSKHKEIS